MSPLGEEVSLRKVSGGSEGYGSEEGLQVLCESVAVCNPEERVHANHHLDLSTISCYGFDMDYTLCEYISPQFDALACSLALDHLVEAQRYPAAIKELRYDPAFAVRGLWFDRETGNLLKTDLMGTVLTCTHGFRFLEKEEVLSIYPGGVQRKDEKRVFVMNTLFNLAETFLVAALIDFFDKQVGFEASKSGWMDLSSGVEITFAQLFKDLRTAIDDIHLTSLKLKKAVVENPKRYVRRDPRLTETLARIRRSGRKTFLLTNSDWWYTQHVMTWVIGSHWVQCFDLVGVDGCKPRFFEAGTPLQVVATLTEGCPKQNPQPAPPGPVVYSGGCEAEYRRMLDVPGEQVIYLGDHLWADIIRCRKSCAWRTMLIVPELAQEVGVVQEQMGLMEQLERLEALVEGSHRQAEMGRRLHKLATKINRGFGGCGSLFRSGSQLSFFGANASIWPDLYSACVANLGEYQLDHMFTPMPARMPHEFFLEEEWVGRRSDRSSPEEESEEEVTNWSETVSTKVTSKVSTEVTNWSDPKTVTSKVAGCLADTGMSIKTDEIVDC